MNDSCLSKSNALTESGGRQAAAKGSEVWAVRHLYLAVGTQGRRLGRTAHISLHSGAGWQLSASSGLNSGNCGLKTACILPAAL